jgi:hypothetical protein
LRGIKEWGVYGWDQQGKQRLAVYRVEYVGRWRTYDVFQLYKLEVLEGKRGDEMFEGMNAS